MLDEYQAMAKIRKILDELNSKELSDGVERDIERVRKICADEELLEAYTGIQFISKSKAISNNSHWTFEKLTKCIIHEAIFTLSKISFESERFHEYSYLLTRYDQISRPEYYYIVTTNMDGNKELRYFREKSFEDIMKYAQEMLGLSLNETKELYDKLDRIVKKCFFHA